MAVSVDQFGKTLVASGLMTADEVKSLWAETSSGARPKDGEGFARLLVERGKLTEFQARQILAGRGPALVLGEYVVLDEIGAGGMGQVYKAQHRRMKRIVALKVMSSAAMKDEASVKRFQREVEAAARLEHPNIVTAYDAGRAGNVNFLVMQFVDGGDLSSLVKKHGPLEIERAVDYVVQAARGLAYAHGEGVIHRDIKPANLLCDKKGVVKILDMGLARLEKGEDGLTATEQVMGTVDYMSPEQASNTKTADARSDVYSLGCTLWYLLTGRKAYDGESLIERLMAHREQPLPSLVKARDDAPWPLEQAFHKMIAKRAADRYQTMDEVVAALEPFGGAPGPGGSGMGSSLGMGSGPRDAELSAFLKTVGPAGAKSATSPNVAGDNTAQVAKRAADTDPKRTAAVRGKAGPPWKPIAAGIGGLAVVVGVAVFLLTRGGDEPAPVVETVVARKTAPLARPTPTASSTVKPLFSPSSAAVTMFTSTPTAPLPPPGDYALDFSAEGSIVSLPNFEFDASGPLTIECWCRPTHDTEGASHIIGNTKRYWITQKKGETRPLTLQANTATDHFIVGDPAGRLPLNRRAHLAGVRDGTQMRFYVNGKRVGQTDKVVGPLQDAKTGFTLGRSFPGLIDEARVSKTARYDADFKPQNRFESDADALALYHFEEGGGTELHDASGNNRHGTILGAKWVQADGTAIPPPPSVPPAAPPPGDYALLFDGNGLVEFDDPLPYAIDSCTIEAYVRVDAYDNRSSVVAVSERGALCFDPVNGQTWVIRHNHDPTETSKGGHFAAGGKNTRPIELARRVHVAGVYSGDGFRIYVDGKLVDKTPPLSNRKFTIGTKPPSIGSLFKGLIDEVRISKSVRYTADFTPPVRHEPDADTLALYHCDEGAGKVLGDASGHGRNGRIVNAKWVQADGAPVPVAPVVVSAPPPGNYALLFDENSLVEFDDLIDVSDKSYTIEAVVRVDGTAKNAIICSAARRGGLGIGGTGDRWRLSQDIEPSGIVSVDALQTIQLGDRHHVAGVRDGMRFRLYVDGKLAAESPADLAVQFKPGRTTPVIGSQFMGVIDEVRISKVARYKDEFTPAAQHEPDADTLALYRCDEGAGKVLGDASGHGRNGRIINAKWVQADGSPVPAAVSAAGSMVLSFDGRTSYVELPGVNLQLAQPFTVEAWTLYDDSIRPDADAYFFSGGSLHLSRLGLEKTWQFYGAQNKSGLGSPKIQSDLPAEVRRWVHVAAVSDGTKRSFYVDGVKQKNTTPNLADVAGGKMLLGALRGSNDVPLGFYPGLLREVRISQTARYSANFPTPQRFTPDADTLALYHCDEGAGDVLTDASGNNRHGRIVGARWAPADPNVLLPDGSMNLALSYDWKIADRTVNALFQPTQGAGGDYTLEALVKLDREHCGGNGHVLTIAGLATFSYKKDTGQLGVTLGGSAFLLGTPELPVDHFAHIAVVGRGGQAQLYIDGKLSATLDKAPPALPVEPNRPGVLIGSGAVKALYDEIRYSTVARYDADFTPPKRFEPDADTQVLYHCDEGRGDYLIDASGQGHHADIRGATWVPVDESPPAQAVALAEKQWVYSDWRPLFDGKSLDGWTGDVGLMTVRDGLLMNEGKRGVVIAPGDYEHCEIELEFRLEEQGNSGLGICYSGTGDPAVNGLEVQLLDDAAYPTVGPDQRCGALFKVAAAQAGLYKPWPEWNHLVVQTLARDLTVTLNGTKVVVTTRPLLQKAHPEHAGAQRTSGKICLFPHTARNQYRNFRVRTATWTVAAPK